MYTKSVHHNSEVQTVYTLCILKVYKPCFNFDKGSDQMFEIERKAYNTVIDGKEITLSFKFELLPNDMKSLAFFAGEHSISAFYFLPLQM